MDQRGRGAGSGNKKRVLWTPNALATEAAHWEHSVDQSCGIIHRVAAYINFWNVWGRCVVGGFDQRVNLGGLVCGTLFFCLRGQVQVWRQRYKYTGKSPGSRQAEIYTG